MVINKKDAVELLSNFLCLHIHCFFVYKKCFHILLNFLHKKRPVEKINRSSTQYNIELTWRAGSVRYMINSRYLDFRFTKIDISHLNAVVIHFILFWLGYIISILVTFVLILVTHLFFKFY